MLTHWLPLNGNAKNQGLNKDWNSTNMTYVDGPMGKAASFTGNCNQKIWFQNPVESQVFSWACWMYLDEAATPKQMIISHGRDYLSYGFNLYVATNASKPSILYGGKESTARLINYELLKKWTHIAVTVDYDYITTYINGTKMDQYPATLLDFSQSTSAITIGKMSYGYTSDTNYFPLHGKICDVRIYDNCISATEVMEISKGLVCHYPLSSTIKKYKNLIWNKTYSIYNNHQQPASLTKLGESFMGSDVYRLTMTVTDSTKLSNFQTSLNAHGVHGFSQTFKANTKYCFTILYRPVTHTGVRVGGTATNIGGWSEIPPVYYRDGWYRVGQKRIGNITENKTDNIFTSFLYKDLKLNEAISIDFCCPCLLEGTSEIEEDDIYEQSFSEDIIYDCSGYGNNGSMVESTAPTWNADSIRYRGCYSFSTNQFIAAGKGAKVTNSITVSVWAYMNTWNGNGRIVSCTEGGGWNFEANGECISFPVYVSSVGYISAKSSVKWTSLSSGWHHFVGTYDGLSAKLYLDGRNIASIGTGKSNNLPISYSPNNTIFVGAEAGGNATTPVGNYFNGKISDLRIYATALSDNEITDLYQRIFSIDQEGGFYCSELIEDNALEKVSLNKTGILTAKDFTEPADLCEQITSSATYTPTTETNSCINPFTVYQDTLIAGDTVTIELDILWEGFDTSNTAGTFNMYFQGALYSDSTATWTSNPYTNALNSAQNLKTLVLSKTSGIYHYVATTGALSASNLSYDRVNIGIRSNYSNGTGKITIQNCHAYNTKDYIGKEKAKLRTEKVLCNKFIEN